MIWASSGGGFFGNKFLLHILAIGISAARSKFAEAPVADHQIAPAFRAELIERNIRHSFALIEPAGCLAIRIACAGHELTEAPALKHHYPATIFAIFFLSGFLNIR